MTQLIVSLNDSSSANDIKKAIKLLQGVVSVKVYGDSANKTTLKAMKEADNGDTIVCENMDEYLKAVGYGL